MTHAVRTLVCQVAVGLAAVVILGLCLPNWAFSVALGVVTLLVAQAPTLLSMWRHEKNRATAAKVVRAYYLNQIIKYLLLVIAVVAYIKWVPVVWPAFIIGVAAIQLSSSLLAIRVKRMAYS